MSIAELISDNSVNFGDPPNMQCCAQAHYIGTVAQKVIEYWRRPARDRWLRDPTLEIALKMKDLMSVSDIAATRR
jgi:hypothetical protein